MKIIVFEDVKLSTVEYYVGTEDEIMSIFRTNIDDDEWNVIVEAIEHYFKPESGSYTNDQISYSMLEEVNLGYIEEYGIAIYCEDAITETGLGQKDASFTKEFIVTEDQRKHGKPFVAEMLYNPDTGKFDRKFYQFDENYNNNDITVAGEYEVSPGMIIEKRENVSWKNDWRSYYLVNEDGEEMSLCSKHEGKKLYRVKKYLRGKLTIDEMLREISEI